MLIPSIIILALTLAIDSFVALFAIGASANAQQKKVFLRLALLIGMFHFFMPLIGWYFSSLVVDYLQNYGVYISGAIFAILGFRMIKEAFQDEPPVMVVNVLKAVMLSYALSIDALAAGFSLSLTHTPYSIFLISSIFALASFAISFIGYLAGQRCSKWNSKYSYIFGGIVLIALGVKSVI